MTDFLQILNFLNHCIIYLLSVRIPLGSDFSISIGSVLIGALFFGALIKIIHLLSGFGTSYAEHQIATSLDDRLKKR